MGRAHCLSRNDRWRIVQLTGHLTRRHEGKRQGCSWFSGGLSQRIDGDVLCAHRGLSVSVSGETASTERVAVHLNATLVFDRDDARAKLVARVANFTATDGRLDNHDQLRQSPVAPPVP